MSTSYEQQILEEVKRFVDTEIRPISAEIDSSGIYPKCLINKLGEKAYLGASLPREYGGLGLDHINYGLFTEIMGKACSATRSLLTVQTSLVAESIFKFGSIEQKERYLPGLINGDIIGSFALTEPLVGSDAKSITTSYISDGGKFILNGSKKWITFGDLADIFVVVASQNNQLSTFIVERSFLGVKTERINGLLAGRGTHLAKVDFDNVEVPAGNVLGKLGNAFISVVALALDNGRYSIAWGGLAISQEALEAIVWYARERKQFGKHISDFQSIKKIIADTATNVHAARCLCIEAGRLRNLKEINAVNITSMAKYYTSKMAMQVSTDAVQVFGGNGCYNEYPVERLFREAKVLEIIEGSSQIQHEIIANYSLRKFYSKNYHKI